MNVMKVALVHSFYRSGVPSGENIAVESQAHALEFGGHQVLVVSRRSDDFTVNALYPLKSGFTVATGIGPSPLSAIEEFEPDVVHAHNLFPNWGTTWLSKIRTPLVATVHNFRPVCSAGTLLRDGEFCELCPTSGSHHAVKHGCYRESRTKTLPLAIASRKARVPPLLERADSIVFLSERTRALYEHYGLGFSEKSHVVPNFAHNSHPEDWRQRSSAGSYWLFAGRLSEEKGIRQLLERWPADVELKVIGGGPEEKNCKVAAEGKNVTFHGQQDREGVDRYLRGSRGLVFPSTCLENSPMIYVEALGHGLPVVALADNAVADDVRAAGTGVVVSTMSDFAGGISLIEADHSGFSARASKRFAKHYSREVWLQRMAEIYNEVARNP